MLSQYKTFLGSAAWVNDVKYTGGFDGNMTITTMLSGTWACSGSNYSNHMIPMCTTVVNDHHIADEVQISWMNDGHPTRNAPNVVALNTLGAKANMSWLHLATVKAFGAETSSNQMVGFYPGTVNPLLWWATPNMQVVATSGIQGNFHHLYISWNRNCNCNDYQNWYH